MKKENVIISMNDIDNQFEELEKLIKMSWDYKSLEERFNRIKSSLHILRRRLLM